MNRFDLNLSKHAIQEILDANGYEIKTLLVYYSPFSDAYDLAEKIHLRYIEIMPSRRIICQKKQSVKSQI